MKHVYTFVDESSLMCNVDQKCIFYVAACSEFSVPAVFCFFSSFFLAVASLLGFQMAWPYYDGMRNTTPNPHCSALSVFPRQQSPTIWKALIPQFLSLSSNGFLHCLSPISFSFCTVSLFILWHFFLSFLLPFCSLIWFSLFLAVAFFSYFSLKYLPYYCTLSFVL